MNEHCLEIETMLAGYALETIPIEARLQVEEHINTCETCRAMLEDYQAIGEGLLGAIPPLQPPPRLRNRLLSKINPTPVKKWLIFQIHHLLPQVNVVAGIAAIAVLVILNVNLLNKTSQLVQSNQALIQQNEASQITYALLTYPDSQVIVIEDEHIYGTLIYDPDGQYAVLNVWGLERLPDGQDYQIWLIEPDQNRVNGGVFQLSGSMEYVSFVIESPLPLDSFTAFGVTVEPEGGSPGPTGPRVFGSEL